MAAGIFDATVGKVRPGTYVNIESNSISRIGANERGTVMLLLPKPMYGPKGAVTISSASVDAHADKLGFSVYDSDTNRQMLLIREAFKTASKVIAYIPAEGTKASVTSAPVKATAKYGGSRGNQITFAIIANPLGKFDVVVYVGGSKVVEYSGLSTVQDLMNQNCAYIDFSAAASSQPTSELIAIAGATLTGGTDAQVSNADITAFLDEAERFKWNTMCFPVDDAALKAAAKSKIKYLRENVGKGVQVVCPNFAANYEGVINVTNAYSLDGDGELTEAEACAWVAGATAAAGNTTALTYSTVEGAVELVGAKNHEDSVQSINDGEFFFSVDEGGNVIVEVDINSLTTFTPKKNQLFRKNRVLRVLDTFIEAIQNNFRPNQFSNSITDWDVMDGIGISLLQMFADAGAITNVDETSDFAVDREKSAGDATYYNFSITPVDSAEKLFFSGVAR